MTAVTPFVFEDQSVRVVIIDGEPWFIAADVCSCIGVGNPAMAVANLDADEKGVSSTDTPGGPQEVIIISESGLYALILRSRKATTPGTVPHRFRRWVTSEVLPTIRKTGKYAIADRGTAAPVIDLERRYSVREVIVRPSSRSR